MFVLIAEIVDALDELVLLPRLVGQRVEAEVEEVGNGGGAVLLVFGHVLPDLVYPGAS